MLWLIMYTDELGKCNRHHGMTSDTVHYVTVELFCESRGGMKRKQEGVDETEDQGRDQYRWFTSADSNKRPRENTEAQSLVLPSLYFLLKSRANQSQVEDRLQDGTD